MIFLSFASPLHFTPFQRGEWTSSREIVFVVNIRGRSVWGIGQTWRQRKQARKTCEDGKSNQDIVTRQERNEEKFRLSTIVCVPASHREADTLKNHLIVSPCCASQKQLIFAYPFLLRTGTLSITFAQQDREMLPHRPSEKNVTNDFRHSVSNGMDIVATVQDAYGWERSLKVKVRQIILSAVGNGYFMLPEMWYDKSKQCKFRQLESQKIPFTSEYMSRVHKCWLTDATVCEEFQSELHPGFQSRKKELKGSGVSGLGGTGLFKSSWTRLQARLEGRSV